MILPNTAMLEIQISWTPEFIFFAFLKHNVEKPLLPNLDYYHFFFFWPHLAAWGILVPQLGIESQAHGSENTKS